MMNLWMLRLGFVDLPVLGTRKASFVGGGASCRRGKRRPRIALQRICSKLQGAQNAESVDAEEVRDDASFRFPPRGAYFNEQESTYQAQLSSAFKLAIINFGVEFPGMLGEIRQLFQLGSCTSEDVPPRCFGFTLSNAGIARREAEREARDGRPVVWPPVRLVYSSVCYLLDVMYDGRPIERFWVLETVARLPYLSFSSCLHLLGTLGWFRSATLMTLHRSEDLNETMHLAVMEALGGDQRWLDRFVAFHASLVYYWLLVALFLVSPRQTYGFSQLLESHAVDTYGQFLDENQDVLRTLPVPDVAHIYLRDFLFYYQEMQVGDSDASRPPNLYTLYDVFANILADEQQHSFAMDACAQFVEHGRPIVYNGKTVSAKSRKFAIENDRKPYWRKWRENGREEENN